MNTYQLEVRAKCPVYPDLIDVYAVTVRSPAMIPVERILEVFKPYETKQVFQETLTQEAASALGATVQVVGMHTGVKVTCIAP